MRSPSVSMSELLTLYRRADESGQLQDIADRRARLDKAVATGRIVLLDRVMLRDPEGALMMALVGSSCGHLIRLPITKEDMAAIVGYARAERIIYG